MNALSDTIREESTAMIDQLTALGVQPVLLTGDHEKDLINNHIERIMNSMCNPLGGVIFSDLVTDLERCSDHAINLAYALKERPSELDAPKLV